MCYGLKFWMESLNPVSTVAMKFRSIASYLNEINTTLETVINDYTSFYTKQINKPRSAIATRKKLNLQILQDLQSKATLPLTQCHYALRTLGLLKRDIHEL